MTRELVLTILAVVGGIASIYSAVFAIIDKWGYFSWYGVTKRCKKLVNMMHQSNYSPDVIIGLGRSGAVIGGILAGNMGVIPITCMDRRYEWVNKRRIVHPMHYLDPQKLSGKKILLVDAAPHTGETCKVVIEELQKMNPAEIRVAALFRTPYQVIVPDYYASTVKQVYKLPWRFSTAYKEDFVSVP